MISGPLWHSIAFKGAGKLLTEFATVYNKYPSIQASKDRVSEIYKAVWRRVAVINILIIPITVCNAINSTYILFGEYLTPMATSLLVVLMAMQIHLTFIPPSSSGNK